MTNSFVKVNSTPLVTIFVIAAFLAYFVANFCGPLCVDADHDHDISMREVYDLDKALRE